MSNRFKRSFLSGFDRRDVVDYVSRQAKEKDGLAEKAAGLEQALDELRGELDASLEENRRLRESLEQAQEQKREADETCRRLQEAVRASILGLNELAGTFDADGDADA